MTDYWTKQRLINIGTSFICMYALLFCFFAFICLINNDLSVSTLITCAVLALLMDLVGMGAGFLGAMMRNNKQEPKLEKTA
jgi:uncharacterized membrane-anchored protein YitT (DUF2179 family)